MVIVNFENQECPQTSSGKYTNRIRKRRNQGVPVLALDRALRNALATSEELDIKDLPDVHYAHLYRNTKHFLASSYEHLKAFGRYLSGPAECCEHCQEYRKLFEVNAEVERREGGRESAQTIYLRECYQSASTGSGNTAVLSNAKRFSDTFVEKVQSQQQSFQVPVSNEMPCCAVCKRPRPSIEFYCACEDPPRRVTICGGHKHGRPPPTRYWAVQKKKKHKKWWCCSKKPSDNWDQCCCCQQRLKRMSQPYPPAPPTISAYPSCPPCPCICQCPQNMSMLQKFKKYVNGKATRFDTSDFDMYNMNMQPEKYQRPSCNWCAKGYNIARSDPQCHYDDAPAHRPRSCSCSCSRRLSVEDAQSQRGYQSEDDYVDEAGSDSDDCCCCCPCRKHFTTMNVQTENQDVMNPKTIDTQTERCCGKRRCCRCCRNGCGVCSRYNCNSGDKTAADRRCKGTKQRGKQSPRGSPGNISPRNSNEPKTRTIICKAASVQHGPTESLPVYPSVSQPPSFTNGCTDNTCHKLQSIMFSNIQPTPLFLDKMFSPITSKPGYNYSANPLQRKMATPFLSAVYQNDSDGVSLSSASISTKTKKRFMNAVCDSILCDLTSKRRNSYSDLLKPPDSGYQEPKMKKSFFSLKKRSSSQKTLKDADKPTKYCMDNMIKTLKGDRTDRKANEDGGRAGNVMGNASKVVRGILEEISAKKDEAKQRTEDASSELFQDESFRNILLNASNYENRKFDLEQAPSDSILLDFESLPGTSSEAAPAAILSSRDSSYTKLMKALDTVRTKTRKLSKS